MHLSKIAINHGETKFAKLNAEKAPFFITKLGVKVLPTICCFIDGVLKD
jgi:thioredoxin-like negative regulator of GroEL